MIKWLSLIAVVAALVWGVAVARDAGRGSGRAGGNPSFSPDGSFIEGSGATFTPITGSSTSLLNAYGLWTVDPHRSDIQPGWGGGDMYPLYLNGHRVPGASQVQRAMIAYGGTEYFSGEDQIISEYGSWQQLPNNGFPYTAPDPPGFPAIPALPTYPPVSTACPVDGTPVTYPSMITNSYGVWSWGNPQTGGYEVRLNGTDINWNSPHLVAMQLQVNSHCQMFIQHPDSTWRVWLDYAEATASAPTGQAIPLHVDMVPTGPLAGHTAVSPACGDLIYRLPSIGSVGRLAGYLTVTMSDGSAFAGTVSILPNGSPPTTLFNASVGGDGVITLTSKQNPMYGLDNFAGIHIDVAQNGTSVSTYNFWFDTGSCP